MAMMTELFAAALQQAGSRLAVRCSKWATQNMRVGNPFPGPLDFKHHPWEREMYDCNEELVVGQKSAQMGYSTAAIGRTLFTLVKRGENVLYLLPTKTPDATDFSTSRFEGILQQSPKLDDVFQCTRNTGQKRTSNSTLYIRGMNSRSALKSVDVAMLVFDEVDEMPREKIPLAMERMAGQVHKQAWMLSTPTVPGYGVNLRLLQTDERHFFIKCPYCGRRVELKWPESFEICGTGSSDPDVRKSRIRCTACDHTLPHETKSEWLLTGEWVPMRPGATGGTGFYINQMYSPTVTPYELAAFYFMAQTDTAYEQEFFNSKLGLAFVQKGAQVTELQVFDAMTRGRTHSMEDALPRGGIITIGCDVGKRLHIVIKQWFFNNDVSTDVNIMSVPKTLKIVAVENFEELGELIELYRPVMTVIDSEPETRQALNLAAKYPRAVKLCKYTKVSGQRRLAESASDSVFLSVDRTSWLDMTLGRYRTGKIYLPRDTPQEFITHICALAKVYRVDEHGQTKSLYVTTGSAQDHYAHADNYAEIALAASPGLGNSDM